MGGAIDFLFELLVFLMLFGGIVGLCAFGAFVIKLFIEEWRQS